LVKTVSAEFRHNRPATVLTVALVEGE
jgi:hypothetical protein